jgi:opacity protein-like surface antigen
MPDPLHVAAIDCGSHGVATPTIRADLERDFSHRFVLSGRNRIPCQWFKLDNWRDGWTVGVGLEYKIARNVSFG